MAENPNTLEEEAPPIDPRDVVFAISRSRYWIVFFAALGLAASILSAASAPNTYTSESQLLLRMGAREELTPEDVVGAGQSGGSRPTIMDEIHMLQDHSIYLKVARELGPDQIMLPADPRRYDDENTAKPIRWFHELQARLLAGGAGDGDGPSAATAADVLRRNTSIRPERFSNVLTVSVQSTSPEQARRLCREVVRAFIARHMEQFSILPYLEDNQKEVRDAEVDFEKARTTYYAHLDECGLLSLDEQRGNLLVEIDTLEKDIFMATVRRKEIEVELRELDRQLGKLSPVVETVIPPIKRANEEYTTRLQLRQQYIFEMENLELEIMTADERNRQKEMYERRIAKLDEDLAALERTVVEEPERTEEVPNEDYVTLLTTIDLMRREDLGLATRLTELTGRLDEKKEDSTRIVDCQLRHEVMQTAIDDKKTTHRKLADRFADLEALASIDLEGDSNLRILKEPDLPGDKDGPNRRQKMLFGLVGGAFVGVLLALLRSFLDPRVRYAHAIERSLGIPVLAVVPERSPLRGLPKAPRVKAQTGRVKPAESGVG